MANESYLAHLTNDNREQTVQEHCRNTAKYAAETLSSVNLSDSAYLAGLLHDAGKFSSEFQTYLQQSNQGQTVSRGSVNHTFAGVRLLLKRWHSPNLTGPDVAAEVLALAAGGHHGWFDCLNRDKGSGFLHRMTKTDIDYPEVENRFFRFCAGPAELDRLFQSAAAEMQPLLEKIRDLPDTDFYAGLLARLLLSGVIEGDRRDTAEFWQNQTFTEKNNNYDLKKLWGGCLERLENKLAQLSKNSALNQARMNISEQCRRAAEQPPGIFRLNVPTGAGKTLSALRFALAHAQKYHKQRIILISPLLSILEQNADVIRNYLQNDSIILEHHSNLVQPGQPEQSEQSEQPGQPENEREKLDKHELLTENWSAPIIITTLVQLLNTLFSGRTTAIRRFQALCNSVILIDEVQTVPSKLLTLFSLAVNFLVKICGATVLLCSATQPCTEKLEHPMLTPIPDLVPYNPRLWAPFQRTRIIDAGEKSIKQIAEFAIARLQQTASLLIVCNKKGEAEELFEELRAAGLNPFLLSAAMCPAHRRDALRAIYASLNQKNSPTICVSTQVIEAGVDISFGCVIRFAAGMDSVIQAAGRCNRNGESPTPAPVYLVKCQAEKLDSLPDIRAGKEATQELLDEFALHPETYGALDSNSAISYYYQTLYRHTAKGQHDYVITKPDYLGDSLFSLLSQNIQAGEDHEHPFYYRQAFRQAGNLFSVLDQETREVIVPYQAGQELIASLSSQKAHDDFAYLQELLNQAKAYGVALYPYQLEHLNRTGGLIPLAGGALGLRELNYNSQTGFSIKNTQKLTFMEV